MYQKRITLFYYSLLIYPKLIPFWSVPVCPAVYFNTPFTLTSFFFPLSARGPTAGATLLGWPNCHNLPAVISGFSGGNKKTQIFASFATNGNIARVKILP